MRTRAQRVTHARSVATRSTKSPHAEAIAGFAAVPASLSRHAAVRARRAAGRGRGHARAAHRVSLPDRRRTVIAQHRNHQSVLHCIHGRRRRVRRFRGTALLPGHVARRACGRRSALGGVCTRHPHGSKLFRDHARRRSAVAADRRHDAGAVDRRRQSLDYAAFGHLTARQPGDARGHEPEAHRHDRGADARRARAVDRARPPRALAVATPRRTASPTPAALPKRR